MSTNCTNCHYRLETPIPAGQATLIGQRQIECRRMPPTGNAIPTQQGGMMVVTVFPIVNASMCCAEWKSEPVTPASGT